MPNRGLKKITCFIFLFAFTGCYSLPVAEDRKKISVTERLKSVIIQDMCSKRVSICSNFTSMKICAVRLQNGRFLYREFGNDCHLFLVNICEFPGREWAIKKCPDSNPRRVGNETQATNEPRSDEDSVHNSEESDDKGSGSEGNNGTDGEVEESTLDGRTESAEDETRSTVDANVTGSDQHDSIDIFKSHIDTESAVTAAALRAGRIVFTTVRYAVSKARDGHKCPQHCPVMHDPVCVNVNRGYGKYFRLLHFSNHCEADRHICANINTVYRQPEGLKAQATSRIYTAAFSNCASGSYMNFVTFAQTATSMAHYGWLAGPQRAQSIVEPPQRMPGAG